MHANITSRLPTSECTALAIVALSAALFVSATAQDSLARVYMNGTFTKTFSSLIPEFAKTASEAEMEQTDSMLTQVSVQVNARVTEAMLSVSKYDSRPNDVSADAPGAVYRYLSVSFTKIDYSEIQSASMSFKVSREWMLRNGIAVDDVTLYRYAEGSWNALNTLNTGGDELYAYYESAVPGFSYFAISGVAPVEITTTTTSPAETGDETSAASDTPSTFSGYVPALAAAIVVLATLVVIVRIRQPRKPKRAAVRKR